MTETSIENTTLVKPEFTQEEYKQRRQRAAALMKSQGIDALVLNSEANNRYFTGHATGRWLNRTRPIFLIITKEAAATILCSTKSEQDTALMTTGGGCEIKVFGGTGHDLNPGLKGLVDELQALGLSKARVAAELGIHHRPQLPPLAFDWLRAALPQMILEDGSDLLWRVRAIKSAGEIGYMKTAIGITHRMYDKVPEWLGTAKTEREVFTRVGLDLLTLGGETVGYRCVNTVGQPWDGGYTDRSIRRDSVIFIDACCSVAGYWSDFCRVFAVGAPTPDEEDTYKRLWDITSEEIAAVRPGMTINQLYSAARGSTERMTSGALPTLGRVGHSIGLEIVEPPSICAEQDWVIEPGMVLCIEPSLTTSSGNQLVAEEMVAVRENGAELLTRRAPERIRRV
ncbi:Xaa-Pro peptidase family protein [Bradyrhizobium sp. B097]|uniref:M24 family metallopeptidase n=1 Tax=Bradyrhizobium sp. B097 TaxID=3140244 RepID=UPI0031841BCA